IEIDTNVVFEGYFSLKLSSTDNGDDYLYFQKNKIIEGYYYISFSYYITSIEYGAYNPAYLYFSYKNINGWQDTVLGSSDSYVADRWQSAFIYAHIDQTTDYPFRILSHGAKFMMYFDNFRIFKTSTEIETIEPSKYEISSTLISWDGYQNPPMPNADVCFQLNKRTFYDENRIYGSYDKTLFDVTARTDENGIATYIYSGGLEQEEYELVSWSPDSFFAPMIDTANYKQTAYVGEQFWVLAYEKAGTETTTLTETEKGSTIKFEFQYDVGGHGSAYIIFKLANSLDNFDAFPIDFAYFYLRSNVSSSEHELQRTHMVDEWSAEVSKNETDTLPTSDFTLIRWDYNHFDTTSPAYDREELFEYLDFWYSPAGYTGGITIEYANFHFVHAQKYYFTPFQVSETDYAETVLLDAWDWTEGDDDGWVSGMYRTTYWIENGYYAQNGKNTGNYMNFLITTNGIDGIYYNSISVHLKFISNVSTIQFKMSVCDDSSDYWANFRYKTYQIDTNTEIFLTWNFLEDWTSGRF
ncbi:MAG: hypothetical protein ACTSSL_13255, partial [Candidatus Heimdallarchaeaceae archaeon]